MGEPFLAVSGGNGGGIGAAVWWRQYWQRGGGNAGGIDGNNTGACLREKFEAALCPPQGGFRGPNPRPTQYCLSNGPNLLSNIYFQKRLEPFSFIFYIFF
jgi:hypothetical protein